jgi:predicted TIM-barrel fold metal-dependent hydrolase
VRGMRLLRDRQLSFDLDADPETMSDAAELAGSCPDTRIILGHAGFPKQRSPEYFRHWRSKIKVLSGQENVWCKVSGLGMGDHSWTADSIRPWIEECLDCFGVDRCMSGTNWPVDSLYSDYGTLLRAYLNILGGLSDLECNRFFYQNACDCYAIETDSTGINRPDL